VKRKWPIIACQVVLAVLFMLMFFETAPWLGARQLTELPTDEQVEPPAWAKSFSYDHGKVIFWTHGTVRDEPAAFGIRVAGTLVLFGAILALIFLKRRNALPNPVESASEKEA
jgi:hypothetical protein